MDLGDETEMGADDVPGEGGDVQAKIGSVVSLLAENCGVKMPDKEYADLSDFLEDLEVALGAYAHAKEFHGVETETGPAANETPVEEVPGAGIAMSLAKHASDIEAKNTLR